MSSAALENREFVVDRSRVDEFLMAVGELPITATASAADHEVPPGFLFYVSTFGAAKLHSEVGISFDTGLFAGLRMDIIKPVRVGDVLQATASVGSRRTQPGTGVTFIEILCEYRRSSDLVLRETSTIALLPSPVESGEAPSISPIGDGGTGSVSDGFRGSRLGVALMASALRDPNPVHVDDQFAGRLGLPSAILHGPFVIHYAVSKAASGELADIRRFDVQMRAPIWVDEPISAEVESQQHGRRRVRVVGADSRVVAVGTVDLTSSPTSDAS